MKMNSTTTALFGALAVCLIAAGIFCMQVAFLSKDFRTMNGEVAGYNNWHNAAQQLVLECAEYSKQHPDLTPLLEQLTGTKAPQPAPAK